MLLAFQIEVPRREVSLSLKLRSQVRLEVWKAHGRVDTCPAQMRSSDIERSERGGPAKDPDQVKQKTGRVWNSGEQLSGAMPPGSVRCCWGQRPGRRPWRQMSCPRAEVSVGLEGGGKQICEGSGKDGQRRPAQTRTFCGGGNVSYLHRQQSASRTWLSAVKCGRVAKELGFDSVEFEFIYIHISHMLQAAALDTQIQTVSMDGQAEGERTGAEGLGQKEA